MKIVLAVDESPCSNAALEFVRKNRWPKGTRVLVISAAPIVLTTHAFVRVGGYAVEPELQEAHRRAALKLMSQTERALQEAGLESRAIVEIGDARDVILRVAAEQNPDLIVMGSHGRLGLKKLLMGSVASHVVAHAPCSVLVVKGSHPGT